MPDRAQTIPASAAPRKRGGRMRAFWQRVSGGFELEQLWYQFVSEARSSYGLYSRDVDWDEIGRERKRWKKPFRVAWALFQAMLMKLTPARRVLLLIAIVLLILQANFRVGDNSFDINTGALGAILLFVVLALELADRVTMKRDLEIAREIQQWLVPEAPPTVPGIDIAFATRPQNTVAGDCYDAFVRPGIGGSEAGRLMIAVADVAGKSVPAAMLMATFQASLRTLAGTQATFDEMVVGLDRYGREHNMGGRRFTTAFFTEIDPATGAMRHINAGHNAPILLRSSGRMERLETGGLPLGLPLLKGVEPHFDCGETKLEKGDLLFIFTDGLVEAVNDDGEEYTEDRLTRSLRDLPRGTASSILGQVMNEVNTFAGAARQHDDITCLVVKMAT